MKNKILNIVIFVITVAITVVALSVMPDIVPVHFDIYGMVDRWGSKYEMLMMPGMMGAMLVFWFGFDAFYKKKLVTSTDEKEIAETKANLKLIGIVSVIISVLFATINCVILYASYSQLEDFSGVKIDYLKLLSIIMGATFVLMGNYMPKAKNNRNIGFRLPWTRYNDVTWNKSNRFAGYAMVITGIILILGGIIFSGIVSMVIMLVTVTVTLPILTIYAYIIYSKEKKNSND